MRCCDTPPHGERSAPSDARLARISPRVIVLEVFATALLRRALSPQSAVVEQEKSGADDGYWDEYDESCEE
jgi:hypothetical protein